MAYLKKSLGFFAGRKAFSVLLESGFSMREAQKICDQKRLWCDFSDYVNSPKFAPVKKSEVVNGEVFLVSYECFPRGLMPLFECEEFGVFDKPSGVLTHPNGRNCAYSLCDEIWSRWGFGACVAHRLDKETSGVLVVAKSPDVARKLKSKFENREVAKAYLAVVKGEFCPANLGLAKFEFGKFMGEFGAKFGLFDARFLGGGVGGVGESFGESACESELFVVDLPLALTQNYEDFKTRMVVSEQGKASFTLVRVLNFDKKRNQTLVACFPLTGRQHQIRVHLFSLGFGVVGDPLYGLSKFDIERILDGRVSGEERVSLTGGSRMMLHSWRVKFEFGGKMFEVASEFNEALEIFGK